MVIVFYYILVVSDTLAEKQAKLAEVEQECTTAEIKRAAMAERVELLKKRVADFEALIASFGKL